MEMELLRILNWPFKFVAFIAYRIYLAFSGKDESNPPGSGGS